MHETDFKTFIQKLMKQKGVKQWEVAAKIGVGETTMTRWLRYELPKEKKDLILSAVNEIAEAKEGSSND